MHWISSRPGIGFRGNFDAGILDGVPTRRADRGVIVGQQAGFLLWQCFCLAVTEANPDFTCRRRLRNDAPPGRPAMRRVLAGRSSDAAAGMGADRASTIKTDASSSPPLQREVLEVALQLHVHLPGLRMPRNVGGLPGDAEAGGFGAGPKLSIVMLSDQSDRAAGGFGVDRSTTAGRQAGPQSSRIGGRRLSDRLRTCCSMVSTWLITGGPQGDEPAGGDSAFMAQQRSVDHVDAFQQVFSSR